MNYNQSINQQSNSPKALLVLPNVVYIRHTGVRFKLVKSNSCSSRLELVGTGKINSLQQHQQMHQQISQNMKRDEEKRRSILNRLHPLAAAGGDSSADVAAVIESAAQKKTPNERSDPERRSGTKSASEKCVKQIVERLETTKSKSSAANGVCRQTNGAAPNSPPRIIDSKCIEKAAGEQLGHEHRVKPPKQLVINPSDVVVTGAADLPVVVTVNNSISIAGSGGVKSDESRKSQVAAKESIYATAKELLEQKQQLERQKTVQQTAKTKVVRNRNVDLALSIVKNQKNVTLNGKEASSTGVHQLRDAKETLKTAEKQMPLLTTFSQQKQQKDKRTTGKIIVKGGRQDKTAAPVRERSSAEEQRASVVENGATKDGQRMIKWSSLNAPKNFDEKFYVSNDNKLKQKKIYDEMEFEEFEVYDTVNAAAVAAAAAAAATNECYDSLNSDK